MPFSHAFLLQLGLCLARCFRSDRLFTRNPQRWKYEIIEKKSLVSLIKCYILLKEYLKLVGIKWYAIWISWWIRNIFIFLILSVTVTILSRIVLRPTNNSPLFAEKAVLMSTDPLILLLLLLTYSVQVCSFIILFSQFFKKRNYIILIYIYTNKNLIKYIYRNLSLWCQSINVDIMGCDKYQFLQLFAIIGA